MTIPEHIAKLVESGRQIGLRDTVMTEGEPCYVSLAIQKHNGVFHAYYFAIKESKMDSDEEELEELRHFSRLEEAWEHLSKLSGMDLTRMTTLKGSKVFNPR